MTDIIEETRKGLQAFAEKFQELDGRFPKLLDEMSDSPGSQKKIADIAEKLRMVIQEAMPHLERLPSELSEKMAKAQAKLKTAENMSNKAKARAEDFRDLQQSPLPPTGQADLHAAPPLGARLLDELDLGANERTEPVRPPGTIESWALSSSSYFPSPGSTNPPGSIASSAESDGKKGIWSWANEVAGGSQRSKETPNAGGDAKEPSEEKRREEFEEWRRQQGADHSGGK